MSGNATYGFVLFYDIISAITAKQYMDGANVGGNFIRVSWKWGRPVGECVSAFQLPPCWW